MEERRRRTADSGRLGEVRNPVLVPAAVATALLVALAVAAAVVTSRPVDGGVPPAALAGAAPAASTSPGTPPGTSPSTPPSTAPPAARAVRPADVLRAWDARRGRAWAAGDAEALRVLYAPGSATAASDLRMLRAWRARGLRVTGLRPEVLQVRVLHRAAARLVLQVTDRWPRAVAVGRGTRRLLPAAPVATRRVELRWSTTAPGGAPGWRVVEVRPTA